MKSKTTKKGGSLKLLGAKLQVTLERLRRKHRVCGASLAILKDGVIHSAACGWANAAERIEATPDTLFQIGSISKTFTATLAMQLVDEGLLNLDAPVRRYLPDFATADPVAQKLTVRHLLAHTSGIDGDFYPSDIASGGAAEGYVRLMRDLGQLHAPGEFMTYCNAGYVVLARIIEVLRNSSWNGLVLTRICSPLGIRRVVSSPTESLRYRMAMGHNAAAKGAWPLAAASYLPLSLAGCGSVLSMSASDLLRYARAHMNGPEGKPGRHAILSRASFRAMQTPAVEMPAYSRFGYSHMGLSWFLDPDEKFPKINHDGTTSQHAYLHILPRQAVAYVLLINSPSQELPEEIRKAVFTEIGGLPKERKPVVAAPVKGDNGLYVGCYSGMHQDVAVSAATRGDLSLHLSSGSAKALRLKLRHVGNGGFAVLGKSYVDRGVHCSFLGEEGGRAKYLRMGVRMMKRAYAR